MLKFYKNETFNLYLKANTKTIPKVYLLNNQNEFIFVGNMKQIDKHFFVFADIKEKIGEYIYKIEFEFDKYVRVKIEENLLDKLYNYTFGNWEVKNNKMYFYGLNGEIIATYNLLDKSGLPTEIAVAKREKI